MPIIAVRTAETENVAFAPIAYCRTNPAAAAGTDRSAAIAAAMLIEIFFFGIIFLTKRNTP